MIERRSERQRDARRNSKGGLLPDERFDAAGRNRFGVRRTWSICPATANFPRWRLSALSMPEHP